MRFEFYVLNYNCNKKCVTMFNIFDNYYVQECCEREVKKYLRAPSKYVHRNFNDENYGFDAFVKEIDSIIKWQEWSRAEYEISVGSLFEKNVDNLEKWDCYKQCAPNMRTIASTIIKQYKEQLKNEKSK